MIREELYNLYAGHKDLFRSVVNRFPFDDLAGPFLMSPDFKYKGQRVPLLVIGQETNGWPSHVEEIEKQMTAYEQFQVGGNSKGYSAFWSMIRKLESILGNEPCSCAWTNLSKFDLYGVRSYGKYEKAISCADTLLAEEVRIVSPSFCVFFTGPYFDNRLRAVFPGLEFEEIEGWNMKQFCKLTHPGLPENTYRAYHPRSLKLKSLEQNFLSHMSEVAMKI